MHPPSGPRAEVLHQARSLLDDLPVVIDHLIIPDATGGIEEIHARCAADLAAIDARRIIRDALAAHLHIEIPDQLIRVVSGGDKGDGFPGISVRWPSGPPPKVQGEPRRRRSDDPPEAPPPPRASDATPRPAQAPTPPPPAPDPTPHSPPPFASGAASTPPVGAGSGRASGRIQFVGVDQAHDRARRIRIRVRLEWDGQVFEGGETGPDIQTARPAILARATLRAVEEVFESTRNAPPVTLTLEGVERVEAFGKSYLVVGAILVTDRTMAPLAGVVPVVEGEERAVVMAALHAVNDEVARLLGRSAPPPSSAATLDAEFGNPFDVWG